MKAASRQLFLYAKLCNTKHQLLYISESKTHIYNKPNTNYKAFYNCTHMRRTTVLIGKKCLLVCCCIIVSCCIYSQNFVGQVTDTSGKPLAFATIKFAGTHNGMVADLEGKFTLHTPLPSFIEVSYLSYDSKKIPVPKSGGQLTIALQQSQTSLQMVVVKTTSNKLKRILNTAIANRSIHNPDKYNWYQCKVYYKMIADFSVPDSTLAKDTSKDAQEYRKFQQEQHAMLSETVSIRTWQRPASLQEQVMASRMSGFNKPLFSSLVTDVLPFHSYNDFINLNGKDYNNPISKGLYQRHRFKLADEILQGKDTLWVIQFTPIQSDVDLGGTMYIHSDGFAIANLAAHTVDTATKRDMGIEQQYTRINGKWFPQHLNYFVNWHIAAMGFSMHMKGTSLIDSVQFTPVASFKFDKAHTVKLADGAGELNDSSWQQARPVPLDNKEVQTYVAMDSLFKKHRIDRLFDYLEKLVQGKWPLGMFDINLNRIYAYNPYEHNRFGWGMQTSEKLNRHFSIGAWAGYGTNDNAWKYGGFGELYLDRYKEFIIRASYYNDLRDPGRLQIHRELDKNFLRTWIMNRVDNVQGWSAEIEKKFGYLTAVFATTHENISPQYNYAWRNEGKEYSSFSSTEVALKLRYAFGETTSPVFGKYYASGSKYPVVYAQIIRGKLKDPSIDYTKVIGAVSWQKNINRFGKESFLLMGGITNSTQLPLSKLFAGNGFANTKNSVYTFGGMQTMFPYDYYADKFVNFYWSHTFNRPMFRLQLTKKSFSSAPALGLSYNGLYGTMSHPETHEKVDFSVPQKGYHEAGILLNSIVRLKVLGLWYATFNVGYFRHLNPNEVQKSNGRFVYGFGFEL
jgi:hypothetical protein